MSQLPVIAIGPKGGKIVGYHDLKHPIYQGSAAAKLLAEQQAKGGGGHVDAGEMTLTEVADALQHYFGVTATISGKGAGAFVELEASDPHAIHAAAAQYGLHLGPVYGGPGKFKAATSAPAKLVEVGDPTVKGGAVTLAHAGEAPAPGQDADEPGPGSVITRVYGSKTYHLTIAVVDGKPKYLVTAPAGTPLFAFSGKKLTGTCVAPAGESLTIAYDSPTSAAYAVAGADASGTAKPQPGGRFWGWKGASGAKPAITFTPGPKPAPIHAQAAAAAAAAVPDSAKALAKQAAHASAAVKAQPEAAPAAPPPPVPPPAPTVEPATTAEPQKAAEPHASGWAAWKLKHPEVQAWLDQEPSNTQGPAMLLAWLGKAPPGAVVWAQGVQYAKDIYGSWATPGTGVGKNIASSATLASFFASSLATEPPAGATFTEPAPHTMPTPSADPAKIVPAPAGVAVAGPPPPASTYVWHKAKSGGAMDGCIVTSAQAPGKTFMVKPDPQPVKPTAEAAGSQISALVLGADKVGIAYTVDVTAAPANVKLKAKLASVQEMLPNAGPLPKDKAGIAKLSTNVKQQLLASEVANWMASDHDAHGAQYLLTPDKQGIIKIDLGQAFKHLGKDQLDTNYHPNAAYNEAKPAALLLLEAFRDGQTELDLHDPQILQAIKNAEAITDQQIEAACAPYAKAVEDTFGKPASQTLAQIKARRDSIRKDFETFFGKILSAKNGKPTPFKFEDAAPAPAPPAPAPPAPTSIPKLYPLPKLSQKMAEAAKNQPSGWPAWRLAHPGPVSPADMGAWLAEAPAGTSVWAKGKKYTINAAGEWDHGAHWVTESADLAAIGGLAFSEAEVKLQQEAWEASKPQPGASADAWQHYLALALVESQVTVAGGTWTNLGSMWLGPNESLTNGALAKLAAAPAPAPAAAPAAAPAPAPPAPAPKVGKSGKKLAPVTQGQQLPGVPDGWNHSLPLPGYTDTVTMGKLSNAPLNAGKTIGVAVTHNKLTGGASVTLTFPTGGALYFDPATGKKLDTPITVTKGGTATFDSATAAGKAVVNGAVNGHKLWGWLGKTSVEALATSGKLPTPMAPQPDVDSQGTPAAAPAPAWQTPTNELASVDDLPVGSIVASAVKNDIHYWAKRKDGKWDLLLGPDGQKANTWPVSSADIEAYSKPGAKSAGKNYLTGLVAQPELDDLDVAPPKPPVDLPAWTSNHLTSDGDLEVEPVGTVIAKIDDDDDQLEHVSYFVKHDDGLWHPSDSAGKPDAVSEFPPQTSADVFVYDEFTSTYLVSKPAAPAPLPVLDHAGWVADFPQVKGTYGDAKAIASATAWLNQAPLGAKVMLDKMVWEKVSSGWQAPSGAVVEASVVAHAGTVADDFAPLKKAPSGWAVWAAKQLDDDEQKTSVWLADAPEGSQVTLSSASSSTTYEKQAGSAWENLSTGKTTMSSHIAYGAHGMGKQLETVEMDADAPTGSALWAPVPEIKTKAALTAWLDAAPYGAAFANDGETWIKNQHGLWTTDLSIPNQEAALSGKVLASAITIGTIAPAAGPAATAPTPAPTPPVDDGWGGTPTPPPPSDPAADVAEWATNYKNPPDSALSGMVDEAPAGATLKMEIDGQGYADKDLLLTKQPNGVWLGDDGSSWTADQIKASPDEQGANFWPAKYQAATFTAGGWAAAVPGSLAGTVAWQEWLKAAPTGASIVANDSTLVHEGGGFWTTADHSEQYDASVLVHQIINAHPKPADPAAASEPAAAPVTVKASEPATAPVTVKAGDYHVEKTAGGYYVQNTADPDDFGTVYGTAADAAQHAGVTETWLAGQMGGGAPAAPAPPPPPAPVSQAPAAPALAGPFPAAVLEVAADLAHQAEPHSGKYDSPPTGSVFAAGTGPGAIFLVRGHKNYLAVDAAGKVLGAGKMYKTLLDQLGHADKFSELHQAIKAAGAGGAYTHPGWPPVAAHKGGSTTLEQAQEEAAAPAAAPASTTPATPPPATASVAAANPWAAAKPPVANANALYSWIKSAPLGASITVNGQEYAHTGNIVWKTANHDALTHSELLAQPGTIEPTAGLGATDWSLTMATPNGAHASNPDAWADWLADVPQGTTIAAAGQTYEKKADGWHSTHAELPPGGSLPLDPTTAQLANEAAWGWGNIDVLSATPIPHLPMNDWAAKYGNMGAGAVVDYPEALEAAPVGAVVKYKGEGWTKQPSGQWKKNISGTLLYGGDLASDASTKFPITIDASSTPAPAPQAAAAAEVHQPSGWADWKAKQPTGMGQSIPVNTAWLDQAPAGTTIWRYGEKFTKTGAEWKNAAGDALPSNTMAISMHYGANNKVATSAADAAKIAQVYASKLADADLYGIGDKAGVPDDDDIALEIKRLHVGTVVAVPGSSETWEKLTHGHTPEAVNQQTWKNNKGEVTGHKAAATAIAKAWKAAAAGDGNLEAHHPTASVPDLTAAAVPAPSPAIEQPSGWAEWAAKHPGSAAQTADKIEWLQAAPIGTKVWRYGDVVEKIASDTWEVKADTAGNKVFQSSLIATAMKPSMSKNGVYTTAEAAIAAGEKWAEDFNPADFSPEQSMPAWEDIYDALALAPVGTKVQSGGTAWTKTAHAGNVWKHAAGDTGSVADAAKDVLAAWQQAIGNDYWYEHYPEVSYDPPAPPVLPVAVSPQAVSAAVDAVDAVDAVAASALNPAGAAKALDAKAWVSTYSDAFYYDNAAAVQMMDAAPVGAVVQLNSGMGMATKQPSGKWKIGSFGPWPAADAIANATMVLATHPTAAAWAAAYPDAAEDFSSSVKVLQTAPVGAVISSSIGNAVKQSDGQWKTGSNLWGAESLAGETSYVKATAAVTSVGAASTPAGLTGIAPQAPAPAANNGGPAPVSLVSGDALGTAGAVPWGKTPQGKGAASWATWLDKAPTSATITTTAGGNVLTWTKGADGKWSDDGHKWNLSAKGIGLFLKKKSVSSVGVPAGTLPPAKPSKAKKTPVVPEPSGWAAWKLKHPWLANEPDLHMGWVQTVPKSVGQYYNANDDQDRAAWFAAAPVGATVVVHAGWKTKLRLVKVSDEAGWVCPTGKFKGKVYTSEEVAKARVLAAEYGKGAKKLSVVPGQGTPTAHAPGSPPLPAPGAPIQGPPVVKPAGKVKLPPITGPDGKQYPAGTTFKTVTTVKTVKDELVKALGALGINPPITAESKGEGWTALQFPVSELGTKDKAAIAAKLGPVFDGLGIKGKPGLVQHVGGTYAYVNVKAETIDKVASSTDEIIPILPPVEGGTAIFNRDDLDDEARLAQPLGQLGHAIEFDSDFVRDMQLRVRNRVKKGNKQRVVEFKLTDFGYGLAEKAFAAGQADSLPLSGGVYDAASGHVVENSGAETTVQGRRISGNGWTAFLANSSKAQWAFGQGVQIEVDPGVTTTAAAMAEFAAAIKAPEMLKPPTDDDRIAFRAMKAWWNVSPQQHDAAVAVAKAGGKRPSELASKAIASLAAAGITTQDLANARVINQSSGHQAVALSDGQKFVDAGVLGVHHSWAYGGGNAASLVAAIKTGAFSSTTTRWTSNIIQSGASSGSDVVTGGAAYFFTRPWTGSYLGSGVNLVFGPETLERTDWHGATCDNYGCTDPTNASHGSTFKSRKGRYAVGSNHETMFQSAIGVGELRAICCDSYQRPGLIAQLKAAGLDKINGIPVDDFVVSDSSEAKALVTDHWKATKAART